MDTTTRREGRLAWEFVQIINVGEVLVSKDLDLSSLRGRKRMSSSKIESPWETQIGKD